MYNTPLQTVNRSLQAEANAVCIIRQSSENKLRRLNGAEAIAQVMASTIQHDTNKELTEKQLHTVENICNQIPVFNLYFRNDHDIGIFLKNTDLQDA